MLSGILVSPGKIELRETPTPAPSKGEVLVKIKSALTCGTDLKAFLRGHPVIPMPGPFGHEFSGTVAGTGKGVRNFKEGDEVMAVHSAPCMECGFCRRKLYNLCGKIMDTKVLGAFAEYIVLPGAIVRQNLFIKPSRLGFEEAAFLEPLSCVVHGMGLLNVARNDLILIIGAGPIGLLHLLMAKLKGARVIITGLEQKRLALARRLGADAAVSPSGVKEAIDELSGGLGVDSVFECTGQPDIWEASVGYARRGGTVVLFGGCRSGATVTYDAARLHYDEIALRGTFHFTPLDVRAAFDLLKKKLDVSPLISGRYHLRDLKTPFERLSKGEGVKYAIIP